MESDDGHATQRGRCPSDASARGAGLDGSAVQVRIDRTKGERPRDVYPPLALLDRTRAYAREERAALVSRRRRRGHYAEPSTVFVSTSGAPLTPRGVGEMFAAASKRAGVAATFHGLRHTYATTMLRALQRQAVTNPDLNPLLTLQVLMGHSDVSTTAIYLQVLATDLVAVERSVDDLYVALR